MTALDSPRDRLAWFYAARSNTPFVKQYSVRDTRVNSLYFANPEAANIFGTIHGGRIMRWMTSTASIAATKVAAGPVLLAHVDDVFFVNPVLLGEVLDVSSWVEYVGTSSMEAAVKVTSKSPIGEGEKLTTYSYMAFVAVDDCEKPRKILATLAPLSEEEAVYRMAEERRRSRLKQLGDKAARLTDIGPYAPAARWRADSARMVFPDDTVYKGIMFAGRLLFIMDEQAGYVADSFARQVCVTASVDSMDFNGPIYVGDFLEFSAALTYVGRSSAEVGVKVVSSSPASGEKKHVGTGFFTYVALKAQGQTSMMPSYTPETSEERRTWEVAEARRRDRLDRLKRFRSSVANA